MNFTTEIVNTTNFDGQKPGTSGLRKTVNIFEQENYTENFIQCILDANREKLKGCTLVVGGDGRYFLTSAIEKIIQICAGNKVGKLIIGQNGILSTPAVSNLIRKYKTLGGIILTASHNPGGIDGDFGIKFNCSNGGPAPDNITNDIHAHSLVISNYKIVPGLTTDITTVGTSKYKVNGRDFEISIVDSVSDYVELMKSIFDFCKLKKLLNGCCERPPFNVLIDSMNGVTGPYVKAIFLDELGASANNVTRILPLIDFGNIHPDPNLTYAKELVDQVKSNPSYDFGAAFDGDGDRNMIIGKNAVFVNPSDSLAVLANNLECIPYFQRNGVFGYARSMPTSSALDRVAAIAGKEIFEVPTGWKYFGNLMDANRISLCGEESFGTGSNHIREKDGIWAVLAWLSIIEHTGLSIQHILSNHWKTFGRNYFTRYDYEGCNTAPCNEMMNLLQDFIKAPEVVGKTYKLKNKCYTIMKADDFSYVDPIDKSITKNQGIRIVFTDGSRIIFRLSGTGSSGATVRLYVESYENKKYEEDVQVMLQPLLDFAFEISKLKEFTGRNSPTVIT